MLVGVSMMPELNVVGSVEFHGDIRGSGDQLRVRSRYITRSLEDAPIVSKCVANVASTTGRVRRPTAQ